MKMKKLQAIVLVLLLSGVLSSCAGTASQGVPQPGQAAPPKIILMCNRPFKITYWQMPVNSQKENAPNLR